MSVIKGGMQLAEIAGIIATLAGGAAIATAGFDPVSGERMAGPIDPNFEAVYLTAEQGRTITALARVLNPGTKYGKYGILDVASGANILQEFNNLTPQMQANLLQTAQALVHGPPLDLAAVGLVLKTPAKLPTPPAKPKPKPQPVRPPEDEWVDAILYEPGANEAQRQDIEMVNMLVRDLLGNADVTPDMIDEANAWWDDNLTPEQEAEYGPAIDVIQRTIGAGQPRPVNRLQILKNYLDSIKNKVTANTPQAVRDAINGGLTMDNIQAVAGVLIGGAGAAGLILDKQGNPQPPNPQFGEYKAPVDPTQPTGPANPTKTTDPTNVVDPTNPTNPTKPIPMPGGSTTGTTTTASTGTQVTDVSFEPVTLPSYLPTVKIPKVKDVEEPNEDVSAEDQEKIILDAFTMANVEEYEYRADTMHELRDLQDNQESQCYQVLLVPHGDDTLNNTKDAPPIKSITRQDSVFKIKQTNRMKFMSPDGYDGMHNFAGTANPLSQHDINVESKDKIQYIRSVNSLSGNDTIAYDDTMNVVSHADDIRTGPNESIFVPTDEIHGFSEPNKKPNYKLPNSFLSNNDQLRAPQYRRKQRIY